MTDSGMYYVLYGGAGDDQIYSSGNTGSLYGGSGNDYLEGDFGTHDLHGGSGNDVLVIPVRYGGGTAWGDAGDDIIFGGDGLHGGAGNDQIEVFYGGDAHGGTGNDTIENQDYGYGMVSHLSGDAGNDLLSGGGARTTFDGGTGTDTAFFSAAQFGFTLSLQGPAASMATFADGSSAGFTINIENVIGGSGEEVLVGDRIANALTGGEGNDTLDGGARADLLTGGQGADQFLFHRTQARGDHVAEFVTSEDQLIFSGYGADATLEHQGTKDLWAISYGAGQHETITLDSVTTLHAGDYVFV